MFTFITIDTIQLIHRPVRFMIVLVYMSRLDEFSYIGYQIYNEPWSSGAKIGGMAVMLMAVNKESLVSGQYVAFKPHFMDRSQPSIPETGVIA